MLEENYVYLMVCKDKSARLQEKIDELERKVDILENALVEQMEKNKQLNLLLTDLSQSSNVIDRLLNVNVVHQKYMTDYLKKNKKL